LRVTFDEATAGALDVVLSFSEQKSRYLSPLIVSPENTFKGPSSVLARADQVIE
jgi:hypothetical protein